MLQLVLLILKCYYPMYSIIPIILSKIYKIAAVNPTSITYLPINLGETLNEYSTNTLTLITKVNIVKVNFLNSINSILVFFRGYYV